MFSADSWDRKGILDTSHLQRCEDKQDPEYARYDDQRNQRTADAEAASLGQPAAEETGGVAGTV